MKHAKLMDDIFKKAEVALGSWDNEICALGEEAKLSESKTDAAIYCALLLKLSEMAQNEKTRQMAAAYLQWKQSALDAWSAQLFPKLRPKVRKPNLKIITGAGNESK